MSIQVEPGHYFDSEYDTKVRFISYWHQIDEIMKFGMGSILEIGIGNGFVSRYLKDRGYMITTLDIDKKLKPDVVSSVLSLPFPPNLFNGVACYEVLEHLPYNNFKEALSEIYRVCIYYAVLSLPDASKVYRFNLQIPKYGEIRKLITLPLADNKTHSFDGQHYWEIGKKDYPLKKVVSDIQKSGFNVVKTYRIFEFPYHRFFVLKK